MTIERINGQAFKELLAAGTALLYERKDAVDSLNVFPVPDGDTGTNMYLTFAAALREVEKLGAVNDLKSVVTAAASGALMGARGNSGVIVSQLFRGFAKAVESESSMGPAELAAGLEGATRVAYQAVRKPVEGTILTVIREAAKRATELARQGKPLADMMREVIAHAEMVLQRTPEMLPTLKEAGVVDAGGQGLIFVFQGALAQFLGEPIATVVVPLVSGRVITPGDNVTSEDEITFHYCTEFIVTGEGIDTEVIRTEIEPKGDCVLVVGDEKTVKIHIHTNNPGGVLEFCSGFGDMHEIQIHNMVDQARERRESLSRPAPAGERKEIGIVAVAVGEGLSEIFRGLGVDEIVEGGQTMNPSTEDLAKAVNRVNAKQVIILPNNGNVIMTANQVKELVDRPVAVIPSKFIPQGISSLMVFNEAQSLDENVRTMIAALKGVKTVEVTYAVRASQYNGVKIEEGDIIGLLDGEIITTGKETSTVLVEALKMAAGEDSSLVTLYHGMDVSEDAAKDGQSRASEALEGCEIEVYRGGQPLYYYICSVE